MMFWMWPISNAAGRPMILDCWSEAHRPASFVFRAVKSTQLYLSYLFFASLRADVVLFQSNSIATDISICRKQFPLIDNTPWLPDDERSL